MAPANRMPSQVLGRPRYDSLHLPDSRRAPAAHGPGWDGHPTALPGYTLRHGPLSARENLMLGLGDPEVENDPQRMADERGKV